MGNDSEQPSRNHPPEMPTLRRDSVVEVTVEKLVYGGQGLARASGMVLFIDGVAPGDRVRARVVHKKKTHAEARVEEILSAGQGRREAPCESFGRCGGCTWQFLDDFTQSAIKAAQVRESLERGAGLTGRPEGFYRPPVVAPSPWHYRNKLDYSFGWDIDRKPALGFHWRGDFRTVVPIPRCHIHPEPFDALLDEMRRWMAEYPEQLTTYHKTRHDGMLRSLIVRRSEATGQSVGLILTATDEELPGGGVEALGQRLAARVPGFIGLLHGINSDVADFSQVQRLRDRWGEESFVERLDDKQFRVSIFSFFQTNTRAAELLYRQVREAARLEAGALVLDAYCGTGSIGIFCSGEIEHLFGIEIVPEAIDDARRNAALNGLEGKTTFWAGDVRDRLADLRTALAGRTLSDVIIDPPRGGMHKKALADLLELRAKRIVYVSCNPTTLARDAMQMMEAGYDPEYVVPVDMFPQTWHVEAVMPFRRVRE